MVSTYRSFSGETRRPKGLVSRRRLRAIGVWLLVVSTCAPCALAHGQEQSGGESDGDSKAQLRPPELMEFVEADYPESALGVGVAGTVVLILTIDKQGKVQKATVQKGPGHGLNEAARRAAENFQFRPARRGGKAVRSRIRYRYTFQFPKDQRAESEESGSADGSDQSTEQRTNGDERTQPERGRVTGTVRRPGGDAPAAGVRVRLVGPEGDKHAVETDEQGHFRPDPLPTGRYAVSVTGADGARASLETEVIVGEATDIRVQMTRGTNQKPIEVTVRGESKGRQLETSARAVEVIETERAGKKADDMGEVVAREEGVGVRRTGGLGSGTRFSLNGLNDNQVRFFLDGIPLELAGFPFGMANVPVNLIDRVDIYNGV
ncbi:MAG: TonB family protein, partial [Bradymonadaceae bacterium]